MTWQEDTHHVSFICRFFFGFTWNVAINLVMKTLSAVPRPHFIATCNPDWTLIDCDKYRGWVITSVWSWYTVSLVSGICILLQKCGVQHFSLSSLGGGTERSVWCDEIISVRSRSGRLLHRDFSYCEFNFYLEHAAFYNYTRMMSVDN